MERRDFVRKAGLGAVALGTLVAAGCTKSEPAGSAAGAAGEGAGLQPGQSKLQEVLKRGKLIVGTGSTNPPWHFEDEKGDLTGFDIAMAKIVAKGLFRDDSKIEFVRQKIDARIPNLQASVVDIVFQFMTVNADRAQLAEFTIPYYREGLTLLLPANSPYSGSAAMIGKRVKISTTQTNYSEDMVHAGVPDAEVLQFDSMANAILAMDSGRSEAACVDLSIAQWYFARNPDKYKVDTVGWWPQTYSGAVRAGDPIWLNFVNVCLHEAMTGVEWPFYKEAFKTYFGKDLRDPMVGFPVEFGDRG